MRVYKNTEVKWLFIPETIIKARDTLSELNIIILKLSKIKNLSSKLLEEKFGLTETLATNLINRLMNDGLIRIDEKESKYQVTKKGEESIEANKVEFEEKIDLKLKLIDDPHLVLSNYWYLPRNIVNEDQIEEYSKETLLEKRDYSNLSKNVLEFTNNPKIFAKTNTTLFLDITENPPKKLFYDDDSGKIKYAKLLSKSEEILKIHRNLWERMNATKINSLIFDKIQIEISTLPFILDLKDNQFQLQEKGDELEDLEMKKALVNYFKEKNFDGLELNFKIEVYDGWNLEIKKEIVLTSVSMIELCFCIYMVSERQLFKELIKEINFKEKIKEYYQIYQERFDKNFEFNELLIAKNFNFLGNKGSMIYGRFLEEELFDD